MRVLIACEFSGAVRDAFLKMGHEAISCDLLPTDIAGPHYQGDVFDIINDGWDLMIAHPPCTDIAVSGAAWFKEKIADGRQQRALDFVRALMNVDIPKICIENPVSVISSKIRKPDQIIQPWMFGHDEKKTTCLWLKNLSKLTPTQIVELPALKPGQSKRSLNRLDHLSPSPERAKLRSKTFQGIADAMAEQWGI
jgi:site-specific DNA-cytosine methylase